MSNNKEFTKFEINKLLQFGRFVYYNEALLKGKLDNPNAKVLNDLDGFSEFKKSFRTTKLSYQEWYSKSILTLKQLIPERLLEFQKLYIDEKRNAKEITYLTYTISDYLLGLVITKGWEKEEVINPFNAFASKFDQQIGILSSCIEIVDYKLSDIEGFLQSELFENELNTAKVMLKQKQIRLSGALAGITLETHLKKVCQNHLINLRKKNPTISDYNEALKSNGIVDLTNWRLVQRLGDVRNLCVHANDRDPTLDEVDDLIRGCEKLIADLF